MSEVRSPRPVCSMAIGTSIMCGSLRESLCQSFIFACPCHTPPQRNICLSWGGLKVVRAFLITRTGDTDSRGSFRCGFCLGFYRGPHPVSNEWVSLLESVWFVEP